MLDASVIVLAWNGMPYLGECLDSLLQLTPAAKEILVVDNASADGSADFVQAQYPSVRLIRNARNLGFAGGMNVGLRAALGNVLVLLNQDTVVTPTWLGEMHAVFQSDSAIAMVGGKALYPDGRIQHAGGVVDVRGQGSHIGYGESDDGAYDTLRDVDFVTGAALAITRRHYAAIGELDEGYSPAYYEDVDWCYRVRTSGGRVVYAPKAVYVHKEASSAGGSSYGAQTAYHCNRLRFVLTQFSMEHLCGELRRAELEFLPLLVRLEPWRLPSMHRAYMQSLLRLDALMLARARYQPVAAGDAGKLSALLGELRACTPAHNSLAVLKSLAVPVDVPAPSLAVASESAEAQPKAVPAIVPITAMRVRPHTFRSSAPIVGPLVDIFRNLWHRVSAEWAIRTVLLQQNAINELFYRWLESNSDRLARLEERQRQLVLSQNQMRQAASQESVARQTLAQQTHQMIETLDEYIAENGRELVDVSNAVRAAAARAETQPPHKPD